MASGASRRKRRGGRTQWDGAAWAKGLALILVAGVAGTLAVLALTRANEAPASTAPLRTFTPAEETPQPDLPLLAVIGDSYTGGSAMNSEGRTWPALLQEDGVLTRSPQLLALGGTGYVATNPDFGPKNFLTNSSEIDPSADVVILFGSRNDGAKGYEDILTAATQTIETVRQRAPKAYILVIGPPWVNQNPPEGILTARDAVATAASQQGVEFVDPIADIWFPSDSSGLIGSDGVHPTDAGHRTIADRMRPLLERALAA